MSWVRLRRYGSVLGAVLLVGVMVGCDSPPPGPNKGPRIPVPEPRDPEPPLTINPPGMAYEDDQYEYTYDFTKPGGVGIYRRNKITGCWEVRDPETGTWNPSGPPPGGAELPSFPSSDTAQAAAGIVDPNCGSDGLPVVSPGPIDYGITPDAQGNVQPLMWLTDYNGLALDHLTADDTMDFHLAINRNWELPIDSNPTLRSQIGESNIIYHELITDPADPDAAVLTLNDVSMRNLVQFLNEFGINYVSSSNSLGVWRLTFEPSENTITVTWKHRVVDVVVLD